MYLIKCSCGCHSTLNDEYFAKRNSYKCPNCGESLNIANWTELQELNSIMEKSGFKYYIIPDNTRIEFKFDANDLG